jgi:hypothetical protein
VLRLAKKSMTAFSVGLALTAAVLLTPSTMVAQEDAGQTPLGDVARSFRKKPSASQTVIDNDNFSKLMDEAESHRLSISSLLYSMNPGEKSFQVSTPDVTCSLSFSANASSLLSSPFVLKDLPPAELIKLDGPATIDGDSLQLSVYNGTEWNLHELTIGLTIVKRKDPSEASYYGSAHLVPAVGKPDQTAETPVEKRSDVTVLYKIKGEAAPFTTTVFRTPLDTTLASNHEWHWAIVRAKGTPSQDPAKSEPPPAQSAPDTPSAPSQPLPSTQSQFVQQPSAH